MRKLTLCMFLFAVFVTADKAAGVLVTFDLTDPGGTAGTAGEALEAGNSFTMNGLTIAASTSGGNGDGFSANSTQGGVADDNGTTTSNRIDAGELLTLTLTFTGGSFELTEIDMNLIGNDSDSALVTIAGGTTMEFHTGITDFNGSTDVWAPSTPIAMTSGDMIVFGADDQVGVQSITFDVAAIPEPSAFLFGGLVCGLVSLSKLRRSKPADVA